ncbi:MAG: helix-turn-helix transcriptional regulator [Blastocatellia bacterium]
MRQSFLRKKGPDGAVLVRTYPVTFPNGYRSRPHAHEWDQLTYAAHGVLTVHTAKGIWVVPPHRAVWVPAGIEHTEEMSGCVAARSLFFVSGLSQALPRDCSTVNVTPLLRELILHATRLGVLDAELPKQARLIGVILDQLEALRAVPFQLPAPRDLRAVKTATLLQQNPGNPESLDEIARQVGASKRTIERLFRAETGMRFTQWRQRLRLIHSLRLLAEGITVTSAALEAGYTSTSAFIAMFKREVGTTPGRYFDSEEPTPYPGLPLANYNRAKA